MLRFSTADMNPTKRLEGLPRGDCFPCRLNPSIVERARYNLFRFEGQNDIPRSEYKGQLNVCDLRQAIRPLLCLGYPTPLGD